MTIDLNLVAMAVAVAGFGCFLWPVIRRVSGRAPPEERADGMAAMRTPLWWAGFLLTLLALLLQRLAAGG
jgi:hypothetical protein